MEFSIFKILKKGKLLLMREGGKIYADGELFYESGKFIEDVLK